MNISHIPNQAGVYFFKDKTGSILYIGKANDLQKRVSQYFSPGSLWKQEMVAQSQSVDFIIVKNESEALYLEDNLIKKHKPHYNNMLKGSNSYAYIRITNEDFPQIYITRKKINDKSTYIGPKHNTIHLKKFLQYIRQVLQYRACKNSQFQQGKLCSDYYFGLCKGRCLNKTKKDPVYKKEYHSLIRYITSFFRGDIVPIQNLIMKQIQSVIRAQNFEWAAKLRDIYNNIHSLSEQQTVVINKPITGYMFEINKIGSRLVYVLLYFHQGKIIDVIRHKFHHEESDIVAIISSIKNECGEFDLNPGLITPNTKHVRGVSKHIKNLSNSDTQNIRSLIGGFFDSYIISTSFEGENLNNELLQTLQTRYRLKKFPYHIECADISHFGGSWASGGLSCLLGGLPEKKYYRRYKITQGSNDPTTGNHKSPKTGGDDYAALSELLIRRFRSKDFLPDLFILDGGKGHLSIIKKICETNNDFHDLLSQIDFISLGKGEARNKTKIGKSGKKGEISEKVYYLDSNFSIKSLPIVYDQPDKVLLNARDEAHRFANSYRENQMGKVRKT